MITEIIDMDTQPLTTTSQSNMPERQQQSLKTNTLLWQRLERECQAMATHAFTKGMLVPASMMRSLTEQVFIEDPVQRVEILSKVHCKLAEVVAPSKPETIALMAQERERKPLFLFLGSVPLIRRMMMVAVISLFAMIGLSLSPYIDNDNMVASMFDMEGTQLLYVQAILLSAAAIGASFAALFKANSYVTAGTYNPRYESSYWVRFVVGLISGIILTQLIPIDMNAIAEATVAVHQDGPHVSQAALRITMALIGGFSANLVYEILDRIVETIQSFISPPVPTDLQTIKDGLQNQFERERQLFINDLSQKLNQIQQQLFVDGETMNGQKIHHLLSELQVFMHDHDRS